MAAERRCQFQKKTLELPSTREERRERHVMGNAPGAVRAAVCGAWCGVWYSVRRAVCGGVERRIRSPLASGRRYPGRFISANRA
jgi:hypothetical protein